jgi:hypothetical protein
VRPCEANRTTYRPQSPLAPMRHPCGEGKDVERCRPPM